MGARIFLTIESVSVIETPISWRFTTGWFPQRWFWRMFPCTKNWNEGTIGCYPNARTGMRVHTDVHRYQNRNRGTFAKTTLFRNRPFLVARAIRNAIRANRFAIETPLFIARQADSHESFEFRANHPIRANRANRFARITPLSAL